MATVEQIHEVADSTVQKFNSYPLADRKKHVPDRTFEVLILDYDQAFRGETKDGEIVDLNWTTPGSAADIRIVLSSDDMIALNEGKLKFATAWASGRVRIDASIRDLLNLRSLAK